MTDYDPTWVRETTFTVRYVGDDGTVDVQPGLTVDYVIDTVPADALAVDRPDQARTWQGEADRS